MSLLAQPFETRGMSLPSRIVMAPMATKLADGDGAVSDALVDYYRKRALAGGVGAIVVEHAYVHPQGRLAPRQLDVSDDRRVGQLARLADAIHEPAQGTGTRALAILQVSHAGGAALPEDLDAGLVGPSAIVHPGRKRSGNTGIVPHALSKDEVAETVGAFAAAARRAAEAGFDGVEVHAAHGYLLDQFYSPIANRRDDGYGPQCVASRARIVCEAVAAARNAVGPGRLVFVRIGPCDYAPGGALVSEGPEYARLLAQAGADVLDVSGGIYNFSTHEMRPPGFFRESSAAIRAAVDVPVLTAGGVHSAADAEWLLASGACDLVGVGRALMRQPAWAARALAALA